MDQLAREEQHNHKVLQNWTKKERWNRKHLGKFSRREFGMVYIMNYEMRIGYINLQLIHQEHNQKRQGKRETYPKQLHDQQSIHH